MSLTSKQVNIHYIYFLFSAWTLQHLLWRGGREGWHCLYTHTLPCSYFGSPKGRFALSSVIHTADSLLTFPLFYLLTAKKKGGGVVWLEPQLESFHIMLENSSEILQSECLCALQKFSAGKSHSCPEVTQTLGLSLTLYESLQAFPFLWFLSKL